MANVFSQKINLKEVLDKVENKGNEINGNVNDGVSNISNSLDEKANDILSQISDGVTNVNNNTNSKISDGVSQILNALSPSWVASDNVIEYANIEYDTDNAVKTYNFSFYLPGKGSFRIKVNFVSGEFNNQYKIYVKTPDGTETPYPGTGSPGSDIVIDIDVDRVGILEIGLLAPNQGYMTKYSNLRICGEPSS